MNTRPECRRVKCVDAALNNKRIKSTLLHAKSTLLHAKSTLLHTKSTLLHTKSTLLHAKSTLLHAKSTLLHTKSTLLHAKSTLLHAKSTLLHTKSTLLHAKSTLLHAKSTLLHTKSTLLHAKSTLLHTKSTLLHAKSTLLHAKSTLLHTKSTLLHAKSTLLHAKSTLLHTKSTLLHTKSTLLHTKSTLLHTKSTLLHAKSTLLHTKSTLLHTKSTLLHTKSTDECRTYVRDDSFETRIAIVFPLAIKLNFVKAVHKFLCFINLKINYVDTSSFIYLLDTVNQMLSFLFRKSTYKTLPIKWLLKQLHRDFVRKVTDTCARSLTRACVASHSLNIVFWAQHKCYCKRNSGSNHCQNVEPSQNHRHFIRSTWTRQYISDRSLSGGTALVLCRVSTTPSVDDQRRRSGDTPGYVPGTWTGESSGETRHVIFAFIPGSLAIL